MAHRRRRHRPQPLASADWATACGLLSAEARAELESAKEAPCPGAIARLGLPTGAVLDTEVWGGNAQARLDGGVLFLAELRPGWRVTAAGCTPRPERPYDCDVEG